MGNISESREVVCRLVLFPVGKENSFYRNRFYPVYFQNLFLKFIYGWVNFSVSIDSMFGFHTDYSISVC